MPKGGRRPGAGRKPGAVTRKTREMAESLTSDGITPLEVLVRTMRDLYHDGKVIEACAIAKDCAPYMHARLASVEAKVDGTLGVYESVPIPVEDRERIPMEGAAGSATGSDS